MTVKIGVHAGHPGIYKACRHPDCLAYRERYRKRWVYDRSQGRLRLTDATPARRHIDSLRGAGWSLRSIAGASGLSPTTVHHVGHGQATVQHRIAAAILAVDPSQVPTKASKQTTEPFVSRIGTTRRIQALLYMGWPHAEMSRRVGMRTAIILSQQGRWVTRTTHDTIAALYRELSHQPGPSNRTRGWATRFGYLGPTAWDDIDLDQAPDTTGSLTTDQPLDEQAIYRRMQGDKTVALTTAERVELAARWVKSGRHLIEMERLTGVHSARYLPPAEEAS